jgi:hypothetical protein
MGDKSNTLRQRVEGTLYREIELRADGIVDENDRTVRVSVSSELPVLRASFFRDPWLETLGHKRGEVDLERLNSGAAVLYNHSRKREDRIGVVENATIKGRRVEATLRLSQREDVNDIWQDIRDGILKNISVGYTINERKLTRESGQGEPSEYRVTSWTPHEVSFVDIPADPTVGVGRSEGGELAYRVIDLASNENEGKTMGKENDDKGDRNEEVTETRSVETRAPATAAPVVDLDTERAAAKGEGVRVERSRVRDINEAFAPYPQFEAVRGKCIDDGLDIADARALLLAEIGKDATPVGEDAVRTEAGEDAVDKFTRAASLSLAVRAGYGSAEENIEVGKTGLRGYTLYELARRSLELLNVETGRMDKMTLVGRAFTTSDFPTLLADVANKSMLKGFEESPETWNIWAQTGSLSDFKTTRRVTLSSFNDLELVNEDGEYRYGSFTDSGETITLATYGKLFAISRQAIINDDMGAFSRIPSAMGRAASRVVGDLAYGVITSNPLMSDGVALFAAGHNNLNESGAGGTPLSADATGTAALSAMRNAMALQTDVSGSATGLNIRPSYLLCPLALEDTARALMTDTTQPGQANPGVRNQIRGLATVVTDPRLDADSVTRYYLAAGQQFDTIEVAFLDGNQSPMLEQQAGWSIDGTEFKVRIDVAAAPMEYRTWQRDDGT